MKAITQRVFTAGIILAMLLGVLPFGTQTVQAISDTIVISQVYGGGGNSGATLKSDFIELYNRGTTPVDVTGWTVQYASSSGTSWQKTTLAGTIQPSMYYLVKEASGSGGTVDLPTPDATGSIPMSGTAGKVALVNHNTTLAGSCPSGLVDFVGFGTATNCFEAAPTANLSNTTAALRNDNGSVDTDNNQTDFTIGTPTPRNGLPPSVLSTVPANGAVDAATSQSITVSFSEPVTVGAAAFALSCSTGDPYVLAVSDGPTVFTLYPDKDLPSGATCTLTVTAAQVTDQDIPVNDPMTDDQVVSFTVGGTVNVCEIEFTPIFQIQGSGTSAAITGNVTTQGIVVGDFEGSGAASGFYLQDLTGDGDTATSDGIFVYNGNANLVSAGDIVRVTGYARERFNQTTINGSDSNNSAVAPNNVIICNTGSILGAVDVTMPFASPTAPEQYEGMLVRFPQPLVIAEYFNYDRFGEIVLALPLDGETRPFTGTALSAPGADANARTQANFLRRITLDDANSFQNPFVLRHPNGQPFSLTNTFRGGDLVTNGIGVLGYDFNLYRIFPTGPAQYTATNTRPEAPVEVGGSVRVAAMNTLNYFLSPDNIQEASTAPDNPDDNICGPANDMECRGWDGGQTQELPRQRTKLLAALSGLDADVIGLNELENTTGVEPLDNIVSGLPGYAYINTGTIGTDAIKVGLIYRPDVVTPVGDFQTLDSADDPRFLDTKSRPALAQTFQVNATGARFTVVVNHLKSKGSDCNDVGDPDVGDGQGNCNVTRTNAAKALVDWLATDPTGSGDPDFLILGDLNSYAMEDPITAVKVGADDTLGTGDDYTNLIAEYQGSYAYSYTFDGQAGYLDHALANASMAAQVTGATEWHINSDEPDVLDYDTSFKPPSQDALYESNAYRTSDHDPVVVGLNLTIPSPTTKSVTGGGWILPTEGDYTAGKANFTFDAKFTKNSSIPVGATDLFYEASNLHYISTGYDWLVIEGSLATLKGSGTVNGEGGYQFMLFAVDGKPDKFRIIIWSGELTEDNIVYDNETLQPIGGGNITIRK